MVLRASACSTIIINSNCNRNENENDGNDSDKSSNVLQWCAQDFTQMSFFASPTYDAANQMVLEFCCLCGGFIKDIKIFPSSPPKIDFIT